MEEVGSDIGTRFAHLLQPIRDLTKNWDIDVASQLEEYLSQLENITISFDGGRTTMNFAEAAFLIQGSTSVYSRKVEYLYALVYQTLDLVACKKKPSGTTSLNDKGEDPDVSYANRRDTSGEFLTLDDLTEGNNIDLMEESVNMSNRSLTCTIVPRTPMSLVPLLESERLTSTPLYSQTGELLGNKIDFKMNTSSLHKSGALLLEPINEIMLELGRDTNILLTTNDGGVAMEGGGGVGPDSMEVEDAGNDCYHGNNDSTIVPPPPLLSPDGADDSDCGKQDSSSKLRPRVRIRTREEEEEENGVIEWKQLDPHEPVKTEKRPFRKCSTQHLPVSLRSEQRSKRKRRRSSSEKHLSSASSKTLSEFLYHSFYTYSSLFPKNPLNSPSTAEFETQYWSEMKRRKTRKAKENITMAKLRKQSAIAMEERLKEEEDIEKEEDGRFYQPFGSDAVDNLIPLQDNIIGDIFSTIEHTNAFHGIEPMALDDQSFCSTSSHHVSMETGNVVQSYEDLVRVYVQSTLAAAVSYAHETDLSKRVKKWEERIKPRLLKEEQTPVFDIHECGTEIVERLSKQGSHPDGTLFSDLVQDKESFEICRLFTAALQLANDRNIEISSQGEGEQCVDTMHLKLISSQMAQEAITNYRAPSVVSSGVVASHTSIEERDEIRTVEHIKQKRRKK